MSIKKDILKNIRWNTYQQVIVSIIGILKLSVLARLLPSEIFGQFAIVMLLIGLTSLFSDFGISVSLFHKSDITKADRSTLYWINMLLVVVMYLLLVVFTHFGSFFFDDNTIKNLVPIMGLNIFFACLGNHFKVYAEKENKFKSIALINIFSNFLGLILALVLALNNYGIYTLIYSAILVTLLSSLMYIYIMYKKYPLSLEFDYARVKSFVNIGMYQLFSSVLDFCSNQLDIMLIGKVLGLEVLGIYNLIKELIKKIYSLTNSIVTKSSIPVFASFNADNTLLKEIYLKLINNISWLSIFVYVPIALLSKEILLILYGESYADYAIILIILSIIHYLNSIGSLAGILIISKGRTDIGFYWVIFRIILTFPLIYIFSKYFGLIGITYGLLIFAIITLVAYHYLVVNPVQRNINFMDNINSYKVNVVFAACLYLAIYLIYQLINFESNLVWMIIYKVSILLVVSIISVWLLFKDKVKEMSSILNLKVNFN